MLEHALLKGGRLINLATDPRFCSLLQFLRLAVLNGACPLSGLGVGCVRNDLGVEPYAPAQVGTNICLPFWSTEAATQLEIVASAAAALSA